MINQWVPWLLAGGNATSAMLTGRHKLAGWPVLAVTQVAFILYAEATSQLGFILQNYVMIGIAFYNTLEWLKKPQPMLLLQPQGI